jgi:hypothetical protein
MTLDGLLSLSDHGRQLSQHQRDSPDEPEQALSATVTSSHMPTNLLLYRSTIHSYRVAMQRSR